MVNACLLSYRHFTNTNYGVMVKNAMMKNCVNEEILVKKNQYKDQANVKVGENNMHSIRYELKLFVRL